MASLAFVSRDNTVHRQSLFFSLGMRTVGTTFIGSIPTITYKQAGFDSVTGNRVIWESISSPNNSPSVTYPSLVGTLQFPHIYGTKQT